MNHKKLLFKYILAIMMFILVFIPFATSLARANRVSGESSQDYSYEDIDAYIEKQLDTLNIPGASLAIIEGDQIVHARGFGVTGPGGAAPTPQTPYFIGSLTKSFTALAVMQLVEAGKIELDAPVQRYLPWFTLADPQAAAQITVRHLLNQSSSLSQIPGMIDLADFDNTPGAAERQARELASFMPARPAGSSFEYSNLNFNLLGLVIEAVSGEKYADYIQNHIYTPLDMRHSYAYKAMAQQDGLAMGYQQWFGFPIAVPNMPVPVGSLPSGQLIASAEDMGHYLIAQLNNGEYTGVRILSPEGIAQMHQPAVKVSLGSDVVAEYGMGWFFRQIDGGSFVYHDGEVPDFFSYMALLPEQNRAMVFLVNTNEQMFNYALWAIGENVALWLAGTPPQPNAWGVLPWAVRGILLLPVLQIIIIIMTLRRVKRWQVDASNRPGELIKWLLHILLPTVLNLVLVSIAIAILASGMLKFIMLFMGDITSVFLVSGAIALVWIIIRTPLILKTLRIASIK